LAARGARDPPFVVPLFQQTRRVGVLLVARARAPRLEDRPRRHAAHTTTRHQKSFFYRAPFFFSFFFLSVALSLGLSFALSFIGAVSTTQKQKQKNKKTKPQKQQKHKRPKKKEKEKEKERRIEKKGKNE
jgi:membrane protein insertase Oxa1/YidC/SpoIIIJ